MPSNAGLVYAAIAVRAEAQPQSWAALLQALRGYADEVGHDMVKASPDMLMRAQGMAIMANEIAQVLEDAPKLHEKFRQVAEGKQHGRQPNATGFRA